jgi:hypothetical protein
MTCVVHRLNTDRPTSCAACHHNSVFTIRHTVNFKPTPTAYQMTLYWFSLLLRMQTAPGDHIPDQGHATPPELFLSHSREPVSTELTAPNTNTTYCELPTPVAYPGILFVGGGVQQIQLRTWGRENGDLGQ